MRTVPQRVKVSIGLGRRVICPVCRQEGILTARKHYRQWYLYVRHPIKEGNRWRIIEHYIGPARLFYVVGSKFLKKPLVRIECCVKPMPEPTEPLSEEPFITFTSVPLEKSEGEKGEKDINRLRQTAIDYASLLLWLREIIDRNIEDLKKSFGITDEEIIDRLNELKEEFITMTFYKKP